MGIWLRMAENSARRQEENRGWWKEGSVSRGKGGPSTMGMLLMGGVMRPDAGPPLGVLHEGHRSQDKGR